MTDLLKWKMGNPSPGDIVTMGVLHRDKVDVIVRLFAFTEDPKIFKSLAAIRGLWNFVDAMNLYPEATRIRVYKEDGCRCASSSSFHQVVLEANGEPLVVIHRNGDRYDYETGRRL